MDEKSNRIKLADTPFTPLKTNDSWLEVEFTYESGIWKGAIPRILETQGLDLNEKEFEQKMQEWYTLLNPKNKDTWIKTNELKWTGRRKDNQTHKVLQGLYSGVWECRVCGPLPKVNPQSPARIRALKKEGYIIGSKTRKCSNCNKSTMHDILVMLPSITTKFKHGNELRAPMSNAFKKRVRSVLGMTEACFNVKRSAVGLVIDHKFPSQRWGEPESPNPNDMSVDEIGRKFQLLSNQTNMWKSRYCDRCVKEGTRGDFMGIEWYYKGNNQWQGKDKHDEGGCIGCPWYDLVKWKSALVKALSK